MTPDELDAELAAGRLRPAYLVAGSEPFLRDRAIAALRAALLGASPSDFDQDRLDGDAVTAGALGDALRTLPVLAPHRVVWLREPEGARAGWRAVLEALPALLRALPPDARTVLVLVAGTPDRRGAWVRAFGDAFVECEAPRDARALARFAQDHARRLGIRLAGDAAERLAERVGPQLARLASELEKTALLAGAGAEVTAEHVASAVADLAEQPVWELTDAIGEGRAGDALALVVKLVRGGAPAPVVLATLAGHFRRLARLRAGGRLAAPPFVVRKLERQSRRYTPARLLTCLHAIHEADEMLKGQGALAPAIVLERLVIGLAA